MSKNRLLILAFSCLLSAATTLQAQTGVMDINGTEYTIDTLEYYMVGPGVMYTKVKLTRGLSMRTLYLLETDMTNPYNKIEEWQAMEEVGKNELLTDAHRKMDYEGHHPIGSVNCNFWCGGANVDVDPTLAGTEGQCLSGTARNGWLIGEPMFNWNRGYPGDDPKQSVGFVMITKEKRAKIDDMWWNGQMRIGTGSHALRDCNRTRTNPNADEIALFNEYLGTKATRATDGVEIIFTPNEWCINEDMTCTVVSVNTTGGTHLQKGQGALQGRGSGKTFMQNLKVGDTFVLNLDIYAQIDQDRPHIQQMITGNCLAMAHGQLMPRNTTEEYNAKDYPRSMFATNEEGDRFWMLISEKPGMKTAELCAVLKHCGATFAAGADGGGSAQMNLFGKIQNPTTEGTPRRLPNSLFVVSTAPESDEVGMLQFVDWKNTKLVSYAAYSPQVRAYTAEGTYLTDNYQDFTLTCEPASLGTFSADGKTFYAAPVTATGTLTAHVGNVSVSKPIEIGSGEINMKYDSLLTDNRESMLEVQSKAGELILPVNPAFLTWTVDDPTVAEVTQGVLKGLKNGQTTVTGELDGANASLDVTVEIAPAQRVAQGIVMDTVVAFSNTRTAAVKISKPMTLYGCPDSVLVIINTDAPARSLNAMFLAKNAKEPTTLQVSGTATLNTDCTYSLPLASVADLTDPGIYPMTLQSLNFSVKDPKKNKDYRFQIKDIILCYSHWAQTSGLREAVHQGQLPNGCKVMIHGKVMIIKNNKMYSLRGIE